MFKLDPAANRINPLEVKRFSDLGFTERKHLQEWLENPGSAGGCLARAAAPVILCVLDGMTWRSHE